MGAKRASRSVSRSRDSSLPVQGNLDLSLACLLLALDLYNSRCAPSSALSHLMLILRFLFIVLASGCDASYPCSFCPRHPPLAGRPLASAHATTHPLRRFSANAHRDPTEAQGCSRRCVPAEYPDRGFGGEDGAQGSSTRGKEDACCDDEGALRWPWVLSESSPHFRILRSHTEGVFLSLHQRVQYVLRSTQEARQDTVILHLMY